jgi:hypothetical protein
VVPTRTLQEIVDRGLSEAGRPPGLLARLAASGLDPDTPTAAALA